MEYTFTFIDVATAVATPLAHDADGWKSYGVTFGRETDISNIVKSYTNSWVFVKEDADYLKSKLFTYGPNRRIQLLIESRYTGGSSTVEYIGYIDLTQASWDADTFTAPLTEGGFYKALENRWGDTIQTEADVPMLYTGQYASESRRIFRNISESVEDDGYLNDLYLPSGNQIEYLVPFTHVEYRDEIFNDNTQDVRGPVRFAPTRDHITYANCICVTQGQGYYNAKVKIKIPLIHFEWDVSGGQYVKDGMKIWLGFACYDFPEGDTSKHPLTYAPIELNEVLKVLTITSPEYVEYPEQPELGVWKDVEIELDVPTHSVNPYMNLAVRIGFAKYHDNSVSDTQLYVKGLEISGGVNVAIQRNRQKKIYTAKATDVFSNLIGEIAGGRYSVTADLSSTSAPFTSCVLASGQCMRYSGTAEDGTKYIPAHFYVGTSLQDFLGWAYACFGYVFTVDYDAQNDTYTAALKPLASVYSNSEIDALDSVNNVQFAMDRGKLYTAIRVGCETDDGVLGGWEEFNDIMTFNAPNTEIEGNVWELVTPYKTAIFSIDQYIADNHGKLDINGTTDGTDADIACFHVALPENPGEYAYLDRAIAVTAGVSSYNYGSVWNVELTPKRMLSRHTTEVDGFFAFEVGNTITFNDSTYNNELVAGGITEADAVAVGTAGVFVPVTVTLDAPATRGIIAKVEANRTGYFSFEYGGKSYRGFIAEASDAVSVNPMNSEPSQFTLLLADL